MTTVFIGGSRRLGLLSGHVQDRLQNMIERGLHVIIGDANGSDRAVQSFLAEKGHRDVVVYCVEGHCRNNVGKWPVEEVEAAGKRGFDLYAQKDARMAQEADCGFMIWDTRSKGTLMNVSRLVDAGKPVVVYLEPDRRSVTIRTTDDLGDLLSECSDSDRRLLSPLLGRNWSQATLFPSNVQGASHPQSIKSPDGRRRLQRRRAPTPAAPGS